MVAYFHLYPNSIQWNVSLTSRPPLYNDELKVLYCIVIHKAFSITKVLLNAALPWKKFGAIKKCVNSCLLSARLVVTSAFATLTRRVCVIFVMPIAVRVDLDDLIVKASVVFTTF